MKLKQNCFNFIFSFTYFIYFVLLMVIVLGTFLIQNISTSLYYILISVIFTILVISIAINKVRKRIHDSFKIKHPLYLLAIFCVAIKMSFVGIYRIVPYADYATFYYTAEKLSKYYIIPESRYIALFPHIFGYSSFLSFFMRLFGYDSFLPALINVALSTLSMIFIYFICRNLMSEFGACIASVIWILFPSQTIYNIFVISEPLYVTELLALFLMVIYTNKNLYRYSVAKIVLLGAAVALLLCFINMARPIAAIPLIAYVIWILIRNKEPNMFKKYIWLLLATVILYFLFIKVGNWYVTQRLGEQPASVPGYNIYVGFNVDSNGGWNQHDSNLLFYYNDHFKWTARQVQSQMLEEAENRIFHTDINFFSLFYKKIIMLWGDDGACISYASSILPHQTRLRAICNIYYFVIIIFSMIGAFFAIKFSDKSELFIICIFMVGLTMAQMAVEVSPRYHYAGIVTFTILGAYGLEQLSRYKIGFQAVRFCEPGKSSSY